VLLKAQRQRPIKNSPLFWLLAALPVFLFLIAIRLENLRRPPPPVYGSVPGFALTERSGRAVTAGDLEGKTWIADFIFTRCAGQCPLMTAKMSELHRSLKGVHFVSFTSDPDYDKPEVLSQYAQGYGITGGRWLFLTGDKEAINKIAQGLHFSRIDEPLMHSLSFVLIDPQGRVRGYYDSTDPEALKKLRRAATRV
jgi:cytochrome oxidase Cu insertion factor (SCO1/SenC/PrrC family)